MLWSLALRSRYVQSLPLIATRIIPLQLREEEEFFTQCSNLTADQVAQAVSSLRDAIAAHVGKPDATEISIAAIFGRSAKVSKGKARHTLEMLEKFQHKSKRRQNAVTFCTSEKVLTASDAVALQSADQRCTICLSDFQATEHVRTLRCGHYFHDVDIRRWLEKNVDCPLCRRPIGITYLSKVEGLCHILLALPSVLHVFRTRRGDSSALHPWLMRLL
jgi:hypothetical protein